MSDAIKGIALDIKIEGVKADKIRQDFLNFLFESYDRGDFLSEEQQFILAQNSLIDSPIKPKLKKPDVDTDRGIYSQEWYTVKNKESIRPTRASIQVDGVTEVVSDGVLVKRVRGNIQKSDWMPKSVVYHTQEFVDWIDSINRSFNHRKEYAPYNLYCQQAEDWFAEGKSLSDFDHEDDKEEYLMTEFDRIACNSLYACVKYGYLQEATFDTGRRKYVASSQYEHQKIQCFLIDAGYSILEGKPRQVGDTTIKGLIAVFKMLTRRNFFLKFITEDTTTGEEIFDDKIKFPFAELPSWMKPTGHNNGSKVLNDTGRKFKIGKKTKSGDDQGINSRIEVVAPSKTAINGGSPTMVYIDEADSIRGLGNMMIEGRPTLYRRNDEGQLEQVRQIVIWSTGTSKQTGGDFEQEWKRVMSLWKEGEYESGIIPIFYDWTCRCDQAEYDRQKKHYLGTKAQEDGLDQEDALMLFNQHYPSCPEDMFLASENTLIPRSKINNNLKRIEVSPVLEEQPVQHGYFRPIYDKSKPRDENSDLPYKVIDATFIPVEEDDPLAVVEIFRHPDHMWRDRYYSGTDPIAQDTGLSKMAMGVWDKQDTTLAALLNFRKMGDVKFTYQQCMLLGLYYDTRQEKKRIPEVLERNIGTPYKDYLNSYGFESSLLFDAELQDAFRSNSKAAIGFDKKGVRADNMISRMLETFNTYSERIMIRTPFVQLKTFVHTQTRGGNITWGPSDKRLYNDDALDAVTYSKICSDSIMKVPYRINETHTMRKVKYKLKMGADGSLYRERVLEKKR